ncbi:MAG: 3-keto-disaccharide hydrolase [Acidobacteriota bacterium]
MMRLLVLAALLAFAWSPEATPHTQPSDDERAGGFVRLFDGKSLAGWRSYKTDAPPAGWNAVAGELVRDGSGGDLMTVAEFGDFELRLEWKISKDGNSGIMFRVGTGDEETWHSGPEFQILDNAGHRDGKAPITSAGANYAVHAPVRDVTKPVGEWNTVRLIARGTHVEHWMNGVKLLEYEIGDADWTKRVNASKFVKYPRYGRLPRGHIVLQDHGNLVTYRNLRIKPL